MKISFYVLLLYKNYKEDILNDNKGSLFRVTVLELVLKGNKGIVREFGILTFREFYDNQPPYG